MQQRAISRCSLIALILEAMPAQMPMSGRPQPFISPSEVRSHTRHRRPLQSPIKTLCASTVSVSSLHTICQACYISATAVHRAEHRIMGYTQPRDFPAKSSSPPKGAKELNEDYTNRPEPSTVPAEEKEQKPPSLSDIIPPPGPLLSSPSP